MKRPQVERGDVDVEAMKGRERRIQYVELALAARFRHRARDVRVVENQRRLLDLEMIEGAARRSHRSSDVALPVIREPFAVQRP